MEKEKRKEQNNRNKKRKGSRSTFSEAELIYWYLKLSSVGLDQFRPIRTKIVVFGSKFQDNKLSLHSKKHRRNIILLSRTTTQIVFNNTLYM